MCPNIEIDNREEKEKFVKNSLHFFGDKKLLVNPTFKGSLSQKKVKGPTKNPINTPSIFQYNMSRSFFKKAGKTFNFYIYPVAGEKYINSKSFQNSNSATDEMLYAEVLASIIDKAAFNLGTAINLLQNFYFKNEILQNSDIYKRGLPVYFSDNSLMVCANTVNICDREFLFELEESIYRLAFSQLCDYGRRKYKKDKAYYNELFGHINDSTLKNKTIKEIEECAKGNHCFLEDIGALYYKDRQQIERLYPEFIKIFDSFTKVIEKTEFNYIEPSLYFSDDNLETYKSHAVTAYNIPAPKINRNPQKVESLNTQSTSTYDSKAQFRSQMKEKYRELIFTPDWVFNTVHNWGYTTPDMLSYNVMEDLCRDHNLNLDGTYK